MIFEGREVDLKVEPELSFVLPKESSSYAKSYFVSVRISLHSVKARWLGSESFWERELLVEPIK